MHDVLTYILTSIVDKPDAVMIDEQDDNGVVTFTITVDKDDMGKVIGKDGKVKYIHTGFEGPGTGIYYEQFKERFNQIINSCLAEKI